MAALRLDSLPAELIHGIVPFLDLTTVCNLRLSNSQLFQKVADCPSFQSHYADKTTLITEAGLYGLLYMTEKGWVPCQVHRLTLVATVQDATAMSLEPGSVDYDGDTAMSDAQDFSTS